MNILDYLKNVFLILKLDFILYYINVYDFLCLFRRSRMVKGVVNEEVKHIFEMVSMHDKG